MLMLRFYSWTPPLYSVHVDDVTDSSGLMSGWFDACPGYVTSLDRKSAFDFTTPYLSTYSTFTVAPNNPSGFDANLDDLSQFTISKYYNLNK